MTAFFATELEGVAVYWRIYRRDGITIGLTSHDRSLYFGGIRHLATPGMVPAAIRLTSALDAESAEVDGALSHAAIAEKDLEAGLFDDAHVEIGAVDWETLDHLAIYSGKIGDVVQSDHDFSAKLRSAKRELERDYVPYTSPTCRAEFCGPGCGLSAAKYSRNATLASVDLDANAVTFAGLTGSSYVGGRMQFVEGPQSGLRFAIIGETSSQALVLDRPLHSDITPGLAVRLIEGCDRTLTTCSSRFGNAVNFRGEPYLPGNDLLARYPRPQ